MASASLLRCLAPTALLVVVAAASVPPASAQAPQRDRQALAQGRAEMQQMQQRTVARGEERSLSDAVRRVQRTTGGHILGAERVPFDGRDINRVKYMDERGRVRYMDDPVHQQRSQPRTPRSDMSSLRGDNP